MMTCSGFAQDGSLRLWKPYSPESFGGGKRQNDGVYGELEAIYWKIDGPRGIPQLDPTIDLSSLDTSFNFGTRITVGNRWGHHGWRASGFGLSNSGEVSTSGLSWEITDPANPVLEPMIIAIDYTTSTSNTSTTTDTSGTIIETVLVPVMYASSTRGTTTLSSTTQIYEGELVYTYRPHPFSWGSIELESGLRAWGLEEHLNLSVEAETIVSRAELIGSTNNTDTSDTGSTGGGLTTDSDSETTSVRMTTTRSLNRQAKNYITGPQIGVQFRRHNQRWTYGADAKFIAGINAQSYQCTGRTDFDFPDISELSNGQVRSVRYLGTETNTPLMIWKKHRTEFSPGVEFALSAKWQWTEAVAFKCGFNSTMFSNVARGANILYQAPPANAPSGTKGIYSVTSHGDDVITYGGSFGIDVRW
ncbi:hypothetical protein FACS189443_0400 [Planctomycetales bacterium]|nr:hypothetical protein FACS189443_0400 [Planctomycetales bacterium]